MINYLRICPQEDYQYFYTSVSIVPPQVLPTGLRISMLASFNIPLSGQNTLYWFYRSQIIIITTATFVFSVHPTRRISQITVKKEMNLGSGSQMAPL